MNLFASISIIKCPICGSAVFVSGMVFKNEPELNITECKNCKTKFQVSRDEVTGKTIIEKLKTN